jgi:hypothetical protein
VKNVADKAKIILFLILFFSCDTSTDPEDRLTMRGFVFQFDSLNTVLPVEGALITAQGLFKQTLSDIEGNYIIKAEPSSDSIDVLIRATKIGFVEATTFLQVAKGSEYTVPDLEMIKVTDVDTGDVIIPATSGEAAHIEFLNHSSQIYVYSTGLKETALFRIKVTDSQGQLLDVTHDVRVNFNILQGPDGGEYLDPDTMTTESGYAFTVLNSGTVAGPVQIEAYIDLPDRSVKSIPARIAIYGGLPDEDHFSVAIEKVNIAGQVHFGLLDNVTAFVGDKYSNPVAPGTIVYFSTEYGIIEGAAETDELGRATVRYMSAAPLPPTPFVSSLTKISAWTFGDTLTGLTLNAETTLLLSAVTDTISVTPASFQYSDSNEVQSFTYNISDIYGNPLVSNTMISIEASEGDLFGETEFSIGDTRFPGSGATDFGITWAPGDSLETPFVFISIKVTSPADGNGSISGGVSGTKVP